MTSDQIHNDLLSIRDWAQGHEVRDTAQFEKISGQLAVITHNHLKHIQDATQNTDEKVDVMQNDIKWITKLVLALSWGVGSIVVAVISALLLKGI